MKTVLQITESILIIIMTMIMIFLVMVGIAVMIKAIIGFYSGSVFLLEM